MNLEGGNEAEFLVVPEAYAKLSLTYPVRTKRLRPNEALWFLRT